ncbi:methyltransferase domain-containing protein [Nocardia sp. NPDC003979]
MNSTRAVAAAEDLLRSHQEVTAPTTFGLLGAEWELLPGVYAPSLTSSAALYAEWLPYPVGGSFCEVGCGTGYLAVLAAERGCARVVALDVSPAAAENTRRNAQRHGVAEGVEVAVGDLFAPLTAEDRFDVVFWNSAFIDGVPESSPADNDLASAFFDDGYRTHRRFLADADRHLAPGGLLLLGFCDLGNRSLLESLAGQEGWRPRTVRACTTPTPGGQLSFELIALERV